MNSQWHLKTESETLSELKTNLHEGLKSEDVDRRRASFGANVLEMAKRKNPWGILLGQFTNFLILVLLGAALIAVFLGEPLDSIAILTIVVLNGILGFTQEYRAEKAMEALQTLVAPHTKVRRTGKVISIPSYELVPGDIVLLEAGNLVPADLRLVESASLEVNESTLTGESNPVGKVRQAIGLESTLVADQRNMAFKGTMVSAGRGTGVVVRTGMGTELGKIASLLRTEIEVETPLQKKIARFAKNIAFLVIGLCVVIFVVGLARGEAPVLMLLTALSLAVAAIPEALPAVVSVTLALGARVMSKRNALVRKLSAVEALGSVTFICSDKTGTLTENRMAVGEVRPVSAAAEGLLYRMLALSNDASVGDSGVLQGDPTETALLAAALEAGFEKSSLETEYPRIAEIPFSAERGMMTTVHRLGKERLVFSKGAPERVFKKCLGSVGGPFDEIKSEAISANLATQGYRVLAFAFARMPDDSTLIDIGALESNLTFVGLVGLIDPPRGEAKEAIELCFKAGIRPVMITGDHPATASAIAGKLGLLVEGRSEVITGVQLSKMTIEQLKERVSSVAVYARVAPEQKIQIVKVLQELGEVVAMTGDGVNDAPALKRADVGVAMGLGGTDVAREASHLILLDDNFATIVVAVSEGRRIYDNIRKFVRFALSGNSGELWTLFLAPFLGLPTPLLPIQILWINLVTDGLPGLALAFEPEEKDVMQRPPRDPKEGIFAGGLWQHSLWVGLLTAGLTLSALAYAYRAGSTHWQSIAFTVLALTQMGHVLAVRSERRSLLTIGLFSNPHVLGAVLLTIALQLMCLYVPIFRSVFKTTPLTWGELILCFAVSSVVFAAVEFEKWIRQKSPT